MNKLVAIVAAAIAAAAPHVASAMPMYDIRDLGTLTGNASYVTAINKAGNVVGASFASGTGTGFYTTGAAPKPLGTLGGATSFPNAINGSDAIVGDSLTASGEDHAFYSLRGSALQDLGTLGGTASSANGINTSRQIVGWAALLGDQTSHAFITTPGGAMQDLGLLNPGDGTSVANAINDQGVVIGYSGGNGFVWTIRNGMQAYGPPNMIVNMTALNNTGQLVGTLSTTDSTTGDTAEHAFVGTLAGTIKDLGTLGSPTYSAAFGINDRGIIVGESYASENQVGTTAFVDDGTAMYDLNAMIPSTPDLYLRTASGINSNGQIVVNGTINGADHAFLLTPNALTYVPTGLIIPDPDYVPPTPAPILAAVPEPASITLLALGLLGAGLSRRRL